jgi:hypothetical protein
MSNLTSNQSGRSFDLIDPVMVTDYLFVHGDREFAQNSKRTKRKLHKKHLTKFFTEQKYDANSFAHQVPQLLYNYLVQMKRNQKKSWSTKNNVVGFLSDRNILTEDVHIIPPPPLEYDILCLQANITEYIWEHPHNNVYWCRTKIADSQNFVINRDSIDKILPLLKTSKTWKDFVRACNNQLNLFTITQYMLSQPTNEIPNYSCLPILPTKALGNMFEQSCQRLDPSAQANLYPSVSFICVLTNTDQFFHTLYSFLKTDYPQDKLELIIVDDIDGEKRLKGNLPNDARIKIVNIALKDDQTNQIKSVPLGYKYNMGVKYASHDMIYHFSDTNYYYVEKFRELMQCFVMFGKDCLMSVDQASLVDNSVSGSPCLDNMLYTKNFWKVFAFDNKQNQSNVMVDKYIKHRLDCIGFVSFLYFSFRYTTTNNYQNTGPYNPLPFNLLNTVTDNMKQSFHLVCTQ